MYVIILHIIRTCKRPSSVAFVFWDVCVCSVRMCKTQNVSVASTPTYIATVVFRGEGCVCVPVGAAGECTRCSSGGRLDRRFLPLSLLCSASP